MDRPPKERYLFQKKPLIYSKEQGIFDIEGNREMLSLPQNRLNHLTAIQTCRIYTEQDFARYVRNEMVSQEYDDFVAHVDTCLYCRQKSEKVRFEDFMENKRLQMKASVIMDALDNGKSEEQAKEEAARVEMFQFIIRADRSSFDIPATTGKLLEASGPPIKQETKGNRELVEPIKILHEFPKSGHAVLANLVQTAAWRMNLSIVVYSRTTNDFLSGIAITLKKGNEILENKISDADGNVIFTLDTRQDHFLTISNDDDLLGFILISAKMPW
jgi:hypothetical protein